MTVFRNEGRFDASNVRFEQGEILVYDKSRRDEAMHHIDYGLSLFHAGIFTQYPAAQPFDLATVLMDLVAARQLTGFEVSRRFYEIGSQEGLDELNRLLQSSSNTL
jgi:NDP-sugar pyrophosphorylase family protein